MTESDLHSTMQTLGRKASAAALRLATASSDRKNQALHAIADSVRASSEAILAANQQDVAAAKANQQSDAYIDRLTLNRDGVEAMASGLEAIAAQDDPIAKTLSAWDRPNGLHIERVSVPLGVIAVIFESRPNVTADAAGLCLKSGNAVVLRPGSDSFHSAKAIMLCIETGLKQAGLPDACVQIVPTSDRAAVSELLKMDQFIDVIVPRGGKSLIQRISEESKIPLFKHLDGICHTYLHANANAEMARDVVLNAKMRRTGICGATETILVDDAIVTTILPAVIQALQEKGCEVRGDETVQALDSSVKAAAHEDWDTEYLDAIISIKTVPDISAAIVHVNTHGSHHTDAIITEDAAAAQCFLNEVDSAIVMHNSSTQFADGGEFGMGAEIGIATGKLHARGPVGIEQLTTFKYQVTGAGQIRQ